MIRCGFNGVLQEASAPHQLVETECAALESLKLRRR
jgi:hypothetical protein